MRASGDKGAPRSAGLLLYRCRPAGREVLLVHPGGPLWKWRNEGAWQIPKGLIAPGETIVAAAIREAREELGVPIEGVPEELCRIRQAGGKRVAVFVLAADIDAEAIRSNLFEMEWPPRSGRRQSFPEADRAAWFGLGPTRIMMLESQRPVLDAFARYRPAPE